MISQTPLQYSVTKIALSLFSYTCCNGVMKTKNIISYYRELVFHILTAEVEESSQAHTNVRVKHSLSLSL